MPLHVFHVDGSATDLRVTSLNISSGGGVFFHSPRKMTVGSTVKYVVTLSAGDPPVEITCVGRVARCELLQLQGATPDSCTFEIACTMNTYRFVSHPHANRKARAAGQGTAPEIAP